MKLSEIKSILVKGDSIESLNIKVKSYLPIAYKTMMINGYKVEEGHITGIVDESIELKNNFATVNYFNKEISTTLNILNYYTDIEIDDLDISDTIYDYIITSGLWYYIKSQISVDEFESIINYINKSIEEKLKEYNSLENIININLMKLIDKIPNNKELAKLSKSLIKDLNKLDINKLTMVNSLKQAIEGNKSK